jgi:hypothetical protein
MVEAEAQALSILPRTRPARIRLAILGAAGFATAALAGMAAGRYVEGDAFAFYKRPASIWPDTPVPEPAPPGWSYPATAAAAEPALPAVARVADDPGYRIMPASTIGLTAADYDYQDPAASVQPASAAADDGSPVIQPAPGSWSEPARPKAVAGEAKEAASSAKADDAEAPAAGGSPEAQPAEAPDSSAPTLSRV